MKIIQIIDSLKMGGAQKLLVTFGREAKRRGLNSTVVSLSPSADIAISDELLNLGIPVRNFHSQRLLDRGRIQRLATFLREENFDAVQTHLTYANIAGVIAARMAHVPCIATFHSTETTKRKNDHLKQKLEKFIVRHFSARAIAVGSAVLDTYSPAIPAQKLSLLLNPAPSGVELSGAERREVRQQLIGDPSRIFLVSVGRLAAPKGFSDLIQAMAIVSKSNPEAVLVIVGGGVLHDELQHLIRQLAVEKNVILAGLRRDVARILAAADLYVTASHWEGLPLAVLEAMAAGLPVVATSVGELPSIITEDVGLLVPPRDPRMLATAMVALLENEQRRLVAGRRARLLARLNHSPEVWMNSLLSLFSEVSGHPIDALREAV